MAISARRTATGAPGAPAPVLLLVLAAGVVTTGLNITALGPLIRPIGAAFRVSDAAVGQLAALHALVAGAAAILVAPWIDRVPRRLVLRVECGLVVLATLLSALAPGYAWLAVGRALAGLGGAIIGATCLACAGDLFPDAGRRNRAIGIISAAFSLSAIVGLPLVTQVADRAGWRWALAALLVPAGLAALGTLLLPDSPRAAAPRRAAAGARAVFGDGRVIWLLAALLLFCLCRAAWTIYFAPFAASDFAADPDALSALFLAGGVAGLLGSVLFPAFLRLGSAARVYGLLTTPVAACLLGVSRLGGPWVALLLPTVVIALGMSALYLATSVLLLDAQPDARGAVMALQTGTFEAGSALGSAATGGLLTLAVGYRDIFGLFGLVLLLSLACVWRSARPPRPAREPLPAPAES
ncbi:MAG TPA: MFS transporter [Thermomicrobiales bacterium]|nr:MFS transporter [Thermomicrobiales bacterium]